MDGAGRRDNAFEEVVFRATGRHVIFAGSTLSIRHDFVHMIF